MTTGAVPAADRSQDLAATQNPSQRWLDELASVDFSPIDQAIARSEAIDRKLEQARLARERELELDRATQLLHLEHELRRLSAQLDELDDAQQRTRNTLREELRNLHDATSELAQAVEALKVKQRHKHSLRPGTRYFVDVMMLLILIITAWVTYLLSFSSTHPRTQGIWPPLADAPPPRSLAPLELTPPPSRLSPPP